MEWKQKDSQLVHTIRLGNLQFLSYLKSQTETMQLAFTIQKFLSPHPFYFNAILTFLKGQPLSFVKQNLEIESQALLEGRSFLQILGNSIEGRRKCLQKIRRDLSKAEKVLALFQRQYFEGAREDEVYTQWVQLEGYSALAVQQSIEHSLVLLSVLFADMARLRQMTLYIVQTVHNWRVTVEMHSEKCRQFSPQHFLHQEQNILNTILTDTSFIWSSKLCWYIWIEVKQDPFLIRNIILLQQRQDKTMLEKYFLDALFPKNERIVDQAVKCFEALFYQHQPKLHNPFEEEQILIKNYLALSAEQQAPQDEDLTLSQQPIQSRINANRGWVFGRTFPTKSVTRVNKIIEDQRKRYTLIRPYNIANQQDKHSIALAYLSQQKGIQNNHRLNRIALMTGIDRQTNVVSEGEEFIGENKFRKTQQKMFRSLTKINPVIIQDPKEHIPDTPTHKKIYSDRKINLIHSPSLNFAKINSFDPFHEQEKIEIAEEQTPLNMKQFLQVFRADTYKNRRKEFKKDQQNGNKKLSSFKELLQNARKERAKSLKLQKVPLRIRMGKKPRQQIIQKNPQPYRDYKAIEVQKKANENNEKVKQVAKVPVFLRAKSIPYDLIVPYIKHITSQQHTTSHSFTSFQVSQVMKKLADPHTHCLIFDILSEKNQVLGQVILSEGLARKGKLRYMVEYLNVHLFEHIIATILKVSQELIATSPCEEIVFPFIVDKLDIVSSHFIDIIDSFLQPAAALFSQLSILQKQRFSQQGKDVRERLYVFRALSGPQRGVVQESRLANYRSLRFDVRSLVLSSNFRLRSQHLRKDTLSKYRLVAVGELFVRVLRKVLTKYHLRELKSASEDANPKDDLGIMLRSDLFLLNLIQNLAIRLQDQEEEDDPIQRTSFSSMADVRHYLRYKGHQQMFDFGFLEESRFILNHQLVLAQFQAQLSLDFALTQTKQIYLLHNLKRLSLYCIRSQSNQSLYLIPTTHNRLRLLLLSGQNYLQQSLDLFSYMSRFLRGNCSQAQLNEVQTIVMPNLNRHPTSISQLRLYDGLFPLFPQREFYSGATMTCHNPWKQYYPPAVIHLPKKNDIVFQLPLIIGIYDFETKIPLTAFLYPIQNT